MACGCNSLTGGIAKSCELSSGGLRKVYITDLCNINSLVLASPSGKISAINMASATGFYEFSFPKNSSGYTEELTSEEIAGSQFYTQTLTLVINRREKVKGDTIQLLAAFKRLAIIVLDSNGKFWLLGNDEGMTLSGNTGGSGLAKPDANNYTLTFTAEEPALANEVESAAVSAVVIL